MKRKNLMFIASVSASVMIASSLLVACTAGAADSGQSEAASSISQAENESVSVAASYAQSSSQSVASQSSRPASSSSTPASSAPPSSQAPAAQEPQSTPPQTAPQAQTPAPQPACPPEPAPAQPPEPAPAPPPAPCVNIEACLSTAAGWASGNNMAVNDGLYIGGAGYENPIDTNGKTDAQVTEHLLYQLDTIHSQLVAMPDFDTGITYPCYKFVVDGSLIYVLYG